MVMQHDAEHGGGLLDLLGHRDIGLRGGRIARWMIVHQNERGGVQLQRPLDDFARVDRNMINRALPLLLIGRLNSCNSRPRKRPRRISRSWKPPKCQTWPCRALMKPIPRLGATPGATIPAPADRARSSSTATDNSTDRNKGSFGCLCFLTLGKHLRGAGLD